jgi:hypothetical protein
MKKLGLGFLILMTVACTNEEDSLRVLRASGYTDINLTGYAAFGCGEDDVSHTGFEATGPTGVRTSGVVCCGWWKSCTIRQ